MNYKLYLLNTAIFENEKKYQESLELLPEARKKKIHRFHNKKDAFNSLGVGLILYYALKQHGLSFEDVTIKENNYGKPYLDNKEIYFNLSHSGNMACGIVSTCQVGIDIEQIIKTDVFADCFDMIFHPEEQLYLNKLSYLSLKEKLELYYRIWTLKESYLKALGVGLSIEMKTILLPYELYKVENPLINCVHNYQEKWTLGYRYIGEADYVYAFCTCNETSA